MMDNYYNAVTVRSAESERQIKLVDGSIFGDGYTIKSLLKECSWGNIYIVSKDEHEYVLKLFGSNVNRSSIDEILFTVHADMILSVLEYGAIDDYFFEIYSYNLYDSLLGKKIQDIEILKEIISQMNEGLRRIHEAGLTHGDIKPSNVFWDRDTNRIFIYDFDAATLRKEGYVVHDNLGTLEYAAPCASSLFSPIKTPAYDYGSLGMMILDLYEGYVHFAGKDESRILNEWEKGINLPEQMPWELRDLLRGLLEANEDKRYGYGEVARWCKNEVVNNKITCEEKTQVNKSMVFGYDNGTLIKINSLEELSICLRQYKDLAKQRFFDSANSMERLIDYVRYFDVHKAAAVRKIFESNDTDAAIFITANILHETGSLFWNNEYYNNLGELMDNLPFSKVNNEFVVFIRNGSLFYYLEEKKMREVADIVKQIVEEAQEDDDYLYYLMKYRFSKNCEGLTIDDIEMYTIEDLCSFMAKDRFKSLELPGVYAKVCAWLYKIGYSEQVIKMKETIRKNE